MTYICIALIALYLQLSIYGLWKYYSKAYDRMDSDSIRKTVTRIDGTNGYYLGHDRHGGSFAFPAKEEEKSIANRKRFI